MSSHGGGTAVTGKRQHKAHIQTLAREGSLYNLTLSEVEGHLGAPLFSMNLDDLLRSVLPDDMNLPLPNGVGNSGSQSASASGLERQGSSITVPRELSKKTVDEVWRDIQQDQESSDEERSSGCEAQISLGEITLEQPPRTPMILLPARLSRTPPPPPQGTRTHRRLRAHATRHHHRISCTATPDMDPAVRKDLYPHVEPYHTGRLNVSHVHTIYYEQSGNPGGHPVVFLHGGPGAGTSPGNRRFFDPEFYRIVLFDQRGAGKSTPHACLEENTTWDLVADIEKLREHLDIPEWQVFGGSWGSTLALAYSQTHPDKVTGIVIRGIFLLRKKELDWFYEGGAAAIFPDAWEPFRDLIPEDERNCFIAAYHKRLTSSDPDVQIEAAKRWTMWEMLTAHLIQNHDTIKRGEDDKFSLAFARIENHYFVNKGFLPSDSHLLDNVEKIRHIKSFIVQGRYDACCPMMSAWDLHKAWPEAEFKVVPDAGHSANEVGIAAELVSANEKLKSMLRK